MRLMRVRSYDWWGRVPARYRCLTREKLWTYPDINCSSNFFPGFSPGDGPDRGADPGGVGICWGGIGALWFGTLDTLVAGDPTAPRIDNSAFCLSAAVFEGAEPEDATEPAVTEAGVAGPEIGAS